ncbi:hypothetical protein P3X46_008009 [Hevea brasiliensis]|uniref:Pentacotripeptide-repeat region of PRORP domain-containing protein n=1 Tax=Hevea brasiliensis TaxID=3981 RepID=A0ABQ9MLF8_HEVBR|nr:hypothetical protein P3X46_008009 [Hevea brasiliensis]
MPSPYTPAPQHLLQSPSLGSTFLFNNICKVNCIKFPGRRLISLPKLSLSTANPAFPEGLSHLIDKKEIGLVENYSGLPIKKEKPETNRLQVENFVDVIRALPCKERNDILNGFTKDDQNWNISDLNDFLMAFLVANEPNLALKLYYDISSHGLAPDSCTFSIIIRCHCKINDADEAKRVLDRMQENGLNPNVATLTTLINSFCKRGKLQKAFEVLEVMERIGCRPTVQIYNCLLKGLCYVGRVEEAYELLEDIKKSSLEPDIYSYTAVMDGFCKVGRSDEAMELLNEALEMGLTPSAVTFNTLFEGYSKEGRPLKGIGVLKKMKQRNCMPDYISYSTLLHGLLIWRKIGQHC